MGADFASREGAALVTGGSGGIGAATAKLLAGRGSKVCFTYRTNAAAAETLLGELTALGADAVSRQLDLTDLDDTVATLDEVEERFGAIHTVIYASGPFVPLDYMSNVSPQQFREQLELDAVAFYNLVQPSISRLRRTRGNVVAVATTALTRAVPRDGLSAGPKGAVEGVIRTIALEEGRFGIRANLVGVGVTTIGMAARHLDEGTFYEEAAMARIPMRSFGDANDIAEAVCFLASDRARYVTGQTINVDGGYSV